MSEKKPKRKVERRQVAKVINVQPPRPADDLFNPFAEAKAAERALVPEYSSTQVPDPLQIEPAQPVTEPPDYSSTRVPEYQSGLVPESRFYKKPNVASDALDRHLTGAESKVFEHLWRL